MHPLLLFLPVLVFTILSIWKGFKPAIGVTLFITIILFFVRGQTLILFFAASIQSLIQSYNIFALIFGALFLYYVLEKTKLSQKLALSLESLHPSREVRFFLISMILTVFFEGIVGFGLPGVIVPVILRLLGFNIYHSIATVLLFDATYVTLGALGTPVNIGLVSPLQLTSESSRSIAFYATSISGIAGLSILWSTFYLYEKFEKTKMTFKTKILGMYILSFMTMVFLAYVAKELALIMTSFVMLMYAYFFIHKGHSKLQLAPWTPYLILTICIILQNFLFTYVFKDFASISVTNILGTKISATATFLATPLISFFIVGSFYLFYKKESPKMYLKPLASSIFLFFKIFPVFLFTSLLMAENGTGPSMIQEMNVYIMSIGGPLPLFTSTFGMFGAYLTGAATTTNILMGPIIYYMSDVFHHNKELMLGSLTTGGAFGNAICFFNIIVACSFLKIKDSHKVLHLTFLPTITATAIAGLLTFSLQFFL